jgi:inorganic triphosphatase YgiF
MAIKEIELKLRVDPQHLVRFRNSSAFADSQTRAATQNLESVYYDTEDFTLRQRGVTLRVRKKGKSYVQTLKVANEHAGGVFSRGEWECPISGALPDLGAIDDPEAAGFLGVVGADTLMPVFASHIKRSVRLLNGANGQPADTVIEVAVDQGELRAIDGTVMPIAEVELELKSGTPQALFDLALKLTEVAPVRVETRTKAERGYALVAGEAQSAVKAKKLELKQEHTAEQALASIMRNCLSHAVLNEAAALKGEDPEGIHQMRVALRRLRSALNLFRDLMPADQYEFLAGEVKWLAGELGNARNLDVFLEELLAPVEEALVSDKPTEALHRAAVASRTRAYEQAQAAILSTRYTVLLLRLGGWLESRSWRQQPLSEEAARLFAPVTELADGLLAKRHRKARKLGKRFAELAPAERHQLRITLKKLRYAAEFFRSLYGEKEVAQYLKRMSALQDDLGHLNDVATAETLMDKLAGEQAESQDAGLWRIGGGMVIGWHARGLNQLEPRLVRDWEKFAKASPFWSKPSDR